MLTQLRIYILVAFLILLGLLAFSIRTNRSKDATIKNYESASKAKESKMQTTTDILGRETSSNFSQELSKPEDLKRVSPQTAWELGDMGVKPRNLISYVKTRSVTKDKVQGVIHDTIIVARSDTGSTSSKQKVIKFKDEWAKFKITTTSDTTADIDYLINNSYQVSVNYKSRPIWKLFSARETEVKVKNLNPHSSTSELTSVVVIPRRKLFGIL